MKVNGKKVMSIALVGLLCTAIYLNWTYSGADKSEDDTAKILGEAAYVNSDMQLDEGDVYADKRMEREKAREQSLELIEQVLTDNTADEGTRKTAQEEKLSIANAIQHEATCETLLKSKGFPDVMVSITGKQAVVCINVKTLIPTQIAQVQDVISSTAGIEPEEIKIVLSH